MNTARRDNRNRVLLKGESQRQDGKYQFAYIGLDGKRYFAYSWRLLPSDPIPKNKRQVMPLRDVEKEILADLKGGMVPASKMTLDKLFDRLINIKEEIRETTKSSYIANYNRYVRGDFGAKPIKSIKRTHIQQFYVDLRKEKSLSGGTLKKINCILQQCFDMAVNDDMLRKNPCKGVILEMSKTGTMKAKKKTALTITQQTEFLAFVKVTLFRYWYPLIVFLLGTGCRIGEAAGLRWKDIDMEHDMIHIRQNLCVISYEKIIHDPKTESGSRDIPMLPNVKEVLLFLAKEREEGRPEDYVFKNKSGGPIDRNCFNRVLKRIVRIYNQEHKSDGKYLPEDLSAHTLRHSFGTRMCENNVNVKVTQTVMGHAEVATTMDIYTDTFEEQIKESFSQIGDKMHLDIAGKHEEELL